MCILHRILFQFGILCSSTGVNRNVQTISFLIIIIFPILFLTCWYFLERRHPVSKGPKPGQVVREMFAEHLNRDESPETFFFSFFVRYETAEPDSSNGKREYDSFKATLTANDPLSKPFNEYLRRWKAARTD